MEYLVDQGGSYGISVYQAINGVHILKDSESTTRLTAPKVSFDFVFEIFFRKCPKVGSDGNRCSRPRHVHKVVSSLTRMVYY